MKKLLISVMVAAFALSTVGFALASTVKCTVDSVTGDKVVMTCVKANKLKVGQKVKVKPAARKAMEGC